MLKETVITIVLLILIFELVEHVILPLVWHMSHRKKKPALGFESMIGKEVQVKMWQKSEGFVAFKGELWSAESDDCLRQGDRAVIERTDGLKLKIKSRKEDKA